MYMFTCATRDLYVCECVCRYRRHYGHYRESDADTPLRGSTIRLRFDDENRVIWHPLLANRAVIRI